MSKLTSSGTVALYHKEGCIQARRYKHAAQRKQILETWARLYGKKYRECDIAITPDINESILLNMDLKKFIDKAA